MTRAKLILAAAMAATAMHGVSAHTHEFTGGSIFRCPIPPGFVAIKTWDEVPPILREKFKDIASLGQDWNPSDVMDDTPMSGVEFVIHKKNRWIVMIGHGGIATWPEAVAYDLPPDMSRAIEVSKLDAETQNACGFVQQFSQGP